MFNRGAPSADQNQAMRLKQIETLKKQFPAAREILRDVEFEIPLAVSVGYIYLRVILPQGFPQGPPYIRVIPNVIHPWVNVTMYVAGHPKLANWNLHNNLGQIVKEVAEEFFKNPPRIIPAPTGGYPNSPQGTSPYGSSPAPTYATLPTNSNQSSIGTSIHSSPPSYSASPTAQMPAYGSSGNLQVPNNGSTIPSPRVPTTNTAPSNIAPAKMERTHTPQPVIPTSFPQLETMQFDDLEHLLNDDDEFSMFFETLDQVKSMAAVRDDLVKNNEDTARKNLSFQNELEQKKNEVDVQQANLKEQRNLFDQQAKRQQEISKRFTPDALLGKLSESVNQAEQISEDITAKFLNKQMDVRDFIKTYMEKKKLYHLRAAKRERFIHSNQLVTSTQ